MEKLCRICRTSDSIEELEEFYEDPKIPVDFYFVTGIKIINIDPSNPAYICSTCIDNIKIFTKFKRKAQKSDEFFRSKFIDFEKYFWLKQKSENFEYVKHEPEVNNSISYFADIGNIKSSTSNIDFIDESNDMLWDGNDEDSIDDENSCESGSEFRNSKVIRIKRKNKGTEADPQSNKKYPVCKLCGKQVSSNRTLQLHMKVVHNTDNKVYICKHCQKIFKHDQYLVRHLRETHNLKFQKSRDMIIKVVKAKEKSPVPFNHKKHGIDTNIYGNLTAKDCKICGREFSSTRSCRDHLKLAHGADKSVFVCKICESRFKLKDYIQRHMRKQHNEQLSDENHFMDRDESEDDEYEEIDQEIVDIAKPSLKDNKNTFCSFCNQELCSRRSYIDHMKIKHGSDDKIYVCRICDAKFVVLNYLKKHCRKIHKHSLKAHEVIIERKEESKKKTKKMKVEVIEDLSGVIEELA